MESLMSRLANLTSKFTTLQGITKIEKEIDEDRNDFTTIVFSCAYYFYFYMLFICLSRFNTHLY